jgi:ABC-type transport system substrate-binding protein
MNPRLWNRRDVVAGAALAAGALPFARRRVAAQSVEEPRRGGTIRFGQSTNPPGYDPHKWWNAAAYIGALAVSEHLIAVDNYTGERIPMLAEAEPTVERDGTRYTFRLRPNVSFHKGYGTLTAADVKYSWERLLNPAFAAEAGSVYATLPFVGLDDFASERSDEIAGLQVVDDLTFQVDLERPDSAFLPAFTYSAGVIVSRRAVEDLGDAFNWNPIGTGAFMVERADPATGARLVRNPDYWIPERPFADAIELEFNVDPELSLLRIQSGELDLMLEPVPIGSINTLRDDPALTDQYFEAAMNACDWLAMPTDMPPFDDVRVRQAAAMAINKEKLIRVVKGLGEPAGGTFFSPLSKYYEEGVAHAYDPEGARQLLAEAGHGEGFEAPFWGWNAAPYADMGPSIQQDLAEIGITADWTPMIYDQFIAGTNPGPPAMMVFGWDNPYNHGSYIIDAAFTSGAIANGCCNYASWSRPEMDEMAEEAHRLDEEGSIAMYKTIARELVRDEAVWVPLVYPREARLVSSRLRGFAMTQYASGSTMPRLWLAD